jgi:hypothetical protein
MNKASLILLTAVCLPVSAKVAFGQRNSAAINKTVNLARQVDVPTDYYGPVALGPFSINNKEGGIEFNKMLSVLVQPAASPGEYVCYHDAAEDVQLVVERGIDDVRLVRGLTLSRINVCPAKRISQASGFSSWVTEKGIRLGSATKEVLSRYGKPSSVWDIGTERGFSPYPREGDHSRMTSRERILVYLPKEGAADTSHAFFGIRNGVVVWMTLSDNE